MKNSPPIPSNTSTWLPVILYVALMFTLTPYLPKIVIFLAESMGLSLKAFVILLRDFTIITLGLLLIILMIHRKRYKEQSSYLALCLIFIWAGVLVNNLGSPADATHLAEYGVLSILVFYKLRRRYTGIRSAPLYIAAAVFTICIGILDEYYQCWLPREYRRYFDVNDMLINAGSAILGLIYVWGIMRPGPLKQRLGSILKGGHKGSDFEC